jgi:hypothetical protein
MKCTKCNNYVHDLAVVCPYCKNTFSTEGRNIPPSFILDRYPEEYRDDRKKECSKSQCSCNCGEG